MLRTPGDGPGAGEPAAKGLRNHEHAESLGKPVFGPSKGLWRRAPGAANAGTNISGNALIRNRAGRARVQTRPRSRWRKNMNGPP